MMWGLVLAWISPPDDRRVEGETRADDRWSASTVRGDDHGSNGFRSGAAGRRRQDRDADGVAVAQHRTGAIPDQPV
jgi:hypothetical protein